MTTRRDPIILPFRPRPSHDPLAAARYDARRFRGLAMLLSDAGQHRAAEEAMRQAKRLVNTK